MQTSNQSWTSCGGDDVTLDQPNIILGGGHHDDVRARRAPAGARGQRRQRGDVVPVPAKTLFWTSRSGTHSDF